MPEVDPFLDQVRQRADYLRGLRTPLRRGVAVVGGVVLAIGSLSACGDSPDAQPEGTQVGAGVAIESETPDNADISPEAGDATSAAATESPDSTPAPAETPLIETQGSPSPTSTTEATALTEQDVIDENKRIYYDSYITNATIAVSAYCSDSVAERVILKDYTQVGGGSNSSELQVYCRDGGVAGAGLIRNAAEISADDDIIFIVTDRSQDKNVVLDSSFRLGADTGDSSLVNYVVEGFGVNPETSMCAVLVLNPEAYNGDISYAQLTRFGENFESKVDVSCGWKDIN